MAKVLKDSNLKGQEATMKEAYCSDKAYRRGSWTAFGIVFFIISNGFFAFLVFFGIILSGCCLSFLLVGLLGRKTMLLTAVSLDTVILVACGFSVHMNYANLVTVLVLLFGFTNGSCAMPVFMTHIVETNPDVTVGASCVLANVCLLISSSIVFPMINLLGPDGYFIFLALIAAGGIIFISIFVRESKGLTDKEKKRLYRP